MGVDNSTQTNPNSTAQTTPDNSYAGATIPMPSTQNPTAPTAPVNPETPTSPTAVPTAVPTAASTAAPQDSAASSPHDAHVSMFDKILRMVNPGTSYVDATGKQQVVRDRATLGNSVIASVLAGMMTPTKYRDGAYGPVVSGDATAAAAYGAGKDQQTAQNAKAQATSDEIQAKKLSVVKNNIDMMHQYAALATQQHQELQGVADRNNATLLKDLGDYDQTVNDPTQKLILGKGLTLQQAMGMLKGKMSSQNMVIDGYQDIMDPDTHQITVQPTFSVINPDQKINMSESAAAELAKYKPAYKNAYDLTGGNIRIPAGQYLSDLHTANSLSAAESFMKRADDALGVKPTMSLAAEAAKDPRVIQSIKEAENALAQGGATADVLDRIQKSPNGNVLLTSMGLDGDKVQKYIDDFHNEQIKNAALAKEGGVGEKVPATQDQLDAYEAARKKLPPDQQDEFIKPPAGGWTQGQLEKEQQRLDQRFSENTKNSIQAGDPEMIANQTRLTIGSGDLTDAKDIYNARAAIRGKYNVALENKAAELGLQPSHFNVEAIKAKSKAFEDYSAGGKVGQQLNAFKTFGEHVAGAKDANDAWQRSGSPLFNKPLSYVAENFTNDQNYKRFQASVIAPAKEYMNFLNQNRAEHEADIKALAPVLDTNATPQSVYTALQTFAKTADDRAKALGETYRDTVGTTFPGLVSKATVDNLAKLGVKSQAASLSGTLPRAASWSSNLQPQTLNSQNPADKAIAQRFFAAAGGDAQKMVEMAHEHGYIINVQ